MTIQAQAVGLSARQFRAFNRAGLANEFDLPNHWEVTTMTAFGRSPRDVGPPSDQRPLTRQRRAIEQIRWSTAT